MKTDQARVVINNEWVDCERFIINFMDGSEQEYSIDPRAAARIKERMIDASSPVFEVASCIFYKDKIKSIQF